MGKNPEKTKKHSLLILVLLLYICECTIIFNIIVKVSLMAAKKKKAKKK